MIVRSHFRFGGLTTGCFFRRHADISGHQSLHEKRVLFKTTCECLEGSRTISIRDHGDQNRYFKSNHNVYLNFQFELICGFGGTNLAYIYSGDWVAMEDS